MAILAYLLLWRTTIGYRIRAVGFNPRASRYAGISVNRYQLLAFLLSGGVTVHPDQSRKLIELGTAVKKAVNDKIAVRHPTIEHITKVELTKIYEKHDPYLPYAKSVVIFGDGQLDRCPCGTGTSAMMAALHANGELPLETEYTNESIIGTQFKGKLLREIRLGEFVAVEPIVTGSAYITGMQQFVSNPNDPFKFGFRIDSV